MEETETERDVVRWADRGAGTTLSKQERKIRLKQLRALQAVAKAKAPLSLDGILSAEPTRAVYVCNGGVACGIKQAQLELAFAAFGPVDNVVLDGLSPFAIVWFTSAAHSEAARRQYHRCSVPELDGRFVFLEYAVLAHAGACYPDRLPAAVTLSPSGAPQHCVHADGLANFEASFERGRISEGECKGEYVGIPGLLLVQDLVSESEERALLAFLEGQEWEGHKLRHVMHYGYRFEYNINNVRPDRPIAPFPSALDAVLKRMACLRPYHQPFDQPSNAAPPSSPFRPDQLTVNRYGPGHGIPPHVDTHSAFEDVLVSLSLGASTVMDFAPAPPLKGAPARVITAPGGLRRLHLPPRSLLVLRGPARYAWTHGIRAHKTDCIDGTLVERGTRVSLTFRTILGNHPCTCSFAQHCDSQCAGNIDSRCVDDR
jgi:alkylated DNA repair protein alkB family protein 8